MSQSSSVAMALACVALAAGCFKDSTATRMQAPLLAQEAPAMSVRQDVSAASAPHEHPRHPGNGCCGGVACEGAGPQGDGDRAVEDGVRLEVGSDAPACPRVVGVGLEDKLSVSFDFPADESSGILLSTCPGIGDSGACRPSRELTTWVQERMDAAKPFLSNGALGCNVVSRLASLMLDDAALPSKTTSQSLVEHCRQVRVHRRDGHGLQRPNDECTICLDELKNATRLGCGHVFCPGCIRPWLRKSRACPICRRRAVLEDPLELAVIVKGVAAGLGMSAGLVLAVYAEAMEDSNVAYRTAVALVGAATFAVHCGGLYTVLASAS